MAILLILWLLCGVLCYFIKGLLDYDTHGYGKDHRECWIIRVTPTGFDKLGLI